jgi:hypothetical protein
MCPALIRAVFRLDELTMYVRLEFTDFGFIVHAGRTAVQEVFECAFTIADHRFRQNEPTLRLAKDAGVFLG